MSTRVMILIIIFKPRCKNVNVFKKKHYKMSDSKPKPAKKTYVLVSIHDKNGKSVNYTSTSEYHNSVPSGAARKAFSAACRSIKSKGECMFNIVVKEKKKDKEFSYMVSRSKLKEPKQLQGRDIDYKVDCTSNRGKPAAKKPAAKKPAAKKPVAKKPVAKKPVTKSKGKKN